VQIKAKQAHRRVFVTRAAVATTVIVALVAAGCGASGSSGSATKQASDQTKHFQIAYFSPIQANSYVQGIDAGIKSTLQKNGASLTVFDANDNPAQQIAQIESATAQHKYNGFIVFPIAPVVPAVTKAIKSGVKVVCVLTICGQDPTATHNDMPGLLTTQESVSIPQEAQDQAEAVGLACKGVATCQVADIPGLLNSPLTTARVKNFLADVKKYPNVDVVTASQSGNDQVSQSTTVTRNLLVKYPGLDVIACSGDQCAQGAQIALTSDGKLSGVKIIGAEGSTIGVARVSQGTWFADSGPEAPSAAGALVTKALITALNGRKAPSFINGNAGLPKVLLKSNASHFKAQWSGS
jgi:ribose transport system substrate-binding protein